MSNLQNTTLIETAEEIFDEAVQTRKFQAAREVIKNLIDRGLTKEAKILQDRLNANTAFNNIASQMEVIKNGL